MQRASDRSGRQEGFSLIELMVGVVVGLLAVYATYQIFENVDKNYRASETTNEAQMTGLYATFAISQELGNAGAGVMSNYDLLRTCTKDIIFPAKDDPGASQHLPLYPLPVAIIPANPVVGADGKLLPDEIFVLYGTGSITDLALTVQTVASPSLTVTIPPPPAPAAGSVLIAATSPNCQALITQNAAPVTSQPGDVQMTVASGQSGSLAGVSPGTRLVDMGNAVRRHFFVDTQGTLQMRIWRVDPNQGDNTWIESRTVPIATNVEAFKVQYGMASAPNGAIDRWMSPDNGTLAQIMANTIQARDIKAIRFGLIVRATEPDTALKNETASDVTYTETLFADCPSGWTCPCPTGLTCNPANGGIDINLTVSKAGDLHGWRYRKYETTVPLQNTIWN
ncbi:MAG: PilW family protein [Proteobacteria bacterium]|nr:PilW family protein [Pseudomonadota bacterium]